MSSNIRPFEKSCRRSFNEQIGHGVDPDNVGLLAVLLACPYEGQEGQKWHKNVMVSSVQTYEAQRTYFVLGCIILKNIL